jgi:hypothetical protein
MSIMKVLQKADWYFWIYVECVCVCVMRSSLDRVNYCMANVIVGKF